MNMISFDIQFGITGKLLCFNSWLDFILHTAWCEMRVGRHSRRLAMVWAIKESRFDYRWVKEISLHFKAPKVFAIIAFPLISTYIFLNLNISFGTLFEGRPICIITKYVLRKFSVSLSLFVSVKVIQLSRRASLREFAALAAWSFPALYSSHSSQTWGGLVKLAHSSDKLRHRQCLSCLSEGWNLMSYFHRWQRIWKITTRHAFANIVAGCRRRYRRCGSRNKFHETCYKITIKQFFLTL
jgi:hypothetical protein